MRRIYVCHTYYHVYVSLLKEFYEYSGRQKEATICLSKMSTDFSDLSQRIQKMDLFEAVVELDEKSYTFFPELEKYKVNTGNVLHNLWNRLIFTKRFPKLEEPYITVDFSQYDEIYVYCDADPIGYYLNYKRIRYHAVEDGLDTLKPFIQAIYDNKSLFKLKKFLSLYLNLLFIRDGYSKYCIDMEVNDLSVLADDFYKYKELPRKKMTDSLTEEQKNIILNIFVKDIDALRRSLSHKDGETKSILILTEPLCALDVRERLFRDLVEEYDGEGTVYLKPHPRDVLNYRELFPEHVVFEALMPMEVFSFCKEGKFDKVVSVLTQLGCADFAEEKVYLGYDFLDKYEDPAVHRKG